MSYLRILNIPILLGLLVVLAACPKAPDTTTISVQDSGSTPSATVIDNTEPPAAGDTNIDVHVDTTKDEPVVVVNEEVRTKYPEVVTVVERTVSTPVVTDNTIYVADAPGITTWTTEVIPASAPADVVYRVRDFNVGNATETEITADGYVLVASPSSDFKSERKYVTYTFRKDPVANQWLIWDIDVTRSEPATADDIAFLTTTTTTTTGGTDAGAASDSSGSSGDSGSGSGGGY